MIGGFLTIFSTDRNHGLRAFFGKSLISRKVLGFMLLALSSRRINCQLFSKSNSTLSTMIQRLVALLFFTLVAWTYPWRTSIVEGDGVRRSLTSSAIVQAANSSIPVLNGASLSCLHRVHHFGYCKTGPIDLTLRPTRLSAAARTDFIDRPGQYELEISSQVQIESLDVILTFTRPGLPRTDATLVHRHRAYGTTVKCWFHAPHEGWIFFRVNYYHYYEQVQMVGTWKLQSIDEAVNSS